MAWTGENIFVAWNRDHRTLAAFADQREPTYVFIRDSISDWISRLNEEEAFLQSLRVNVPQSADGATISEPFIDSCNWFLDLNETKEFLLEHKGVLLVQGGPGCGKSTLCRYLTNTLPNVLGYSFSAANGHSSASAMASLLLQAFERRPELIAHALDHDRRYRRRGRSPAAMSFHALSIIFTEVARSLHNPIVKTVIIVDGIDEIVPEEDMVPFFDYFRRLEPLPCIMTTRHRQELEHSNVERIDWSVHFPESVLKAYIDAECRQAFGRRSYDIQTLVPRIGKTIDHLAGGNFLFAHLTLQALRRGLEEGQSLDELSQLLSTNASYDRLLDLYRRSSPVQWHIMCETLPICLVAIEPMTTHTLLEALNVKALYPYTRPSTRTEPLRMIGLVDMLASSPLLRSSEHGRIRLVHRSMNAYILDSKVLQESLPDFTLEAAHLDLAARCVTTIHASVRLGIQASPHRDDFLTYAAAHWVHHYAAAECDVEGALLESAYNLFTNDSQTSISWWQIYENENNEILPWHASSQPLLGSAYFGLSTIVKRLVKTGIDIEARDQDGKSALHWADQRGHIKIVQLLVANGASVDGTTSAGWTPLHVAAETGNVEMTRLLLGHGADPNARAGDGQTAVHFAAELGHIDVVSELLNAGADPSEPSYDGVDVFELAIRASSTSSSRPSLMETLMENRSAAVALLQRCIFENDSDKLKLLAKWRKDVVSEEHPWVGELLEQEFPEHEILELLLKSENLEWTELDPWEVPKMDLCTPDSLRHQHPCAHRLDTTATTPYAKAANRPLQATTKTDPKELQVAVPGQFDSSQLLSPEKSLQKVEEREQNLIKLCGIGGVFPPTDDGALNPGVARMQRHLVQIIYGEEYQVMLLFPSKRPI
jgi:hypothetical protein